MSEVSKSQPCSGGTPSASSSGCDVTCCLSDACASLVGRSSKSIRNTNPRSAICPHLSRLNRGSALKILWSSWCDLKAPNCWPRPHPLSLFEMYWALCLSFVARFHAEVFGYARTLVAQYSLAICPRLKPGGLAGDDTPGHNPHRSA